LAATAAAPAPVTHETAMAELRSVLALDDAQVAAIETIFAERQKTVQRVWEQLRPEVQHAMADVHHEIDEVLRPDQRDRFLTWLHQRQHNRLH
jgi:Spy/CpxP family protein refolding chaperone